MAITDDIILLKLIQEDDEKAFKLLFDTYFSSLCRFMLIYLPDKQEVEEIALTIFINVWENRHTLSLKISFKAYLFQAAKNRCFNRIRDLKETASLNEAEHYFSDFETDTSLEMEELNTLIQEAICSLPDRCQQVFRLSREEEKSYQEIANQLNISIKTVEAQITKALRLMKEYLGNKYTYLF